MVPKAHSDDLDGEVRKPVEIKKTTGRDEDSAAKVRRLAEQMRFRLKEAMAQRGSSEAFVHWLQTDDGRGLKAGR